MTTPLPEADRSVRRQLLLTRIAVERVQLTHDLQRLRQSASPRRLLQAGFAATPLAGLFSRPAGAGTGAGTSSWAETLFTLWQRWRRVAPVFGPAASLLSPLFGRHRWLRRAALWAALAGGLLAARRPR